MSTMNPYTPIRQALGQLRADVEQMYQDALTAERAFQGEPAPVPPPLVIESTPTQLSRFNAAALATPRRGRPRKSASPPPCDLDDLPGPGGAGEPRIPGASWEAA